MKNLLLSLLLLPSLLYANIEKQVVNIQGQTLGPDFAIAQAPSVKFKDCVFDGTGGEVALLLNGCNNISFDNCVFLTGSNYGLDVAPGHPWSFEDEALLRGLRWKPGNQFIEGTNLRGHIGSYKDGDSGLYNGFGTGSSLITIPFKGAPVLDPFTLSSNVWTIHTNETLYCKLVSLDSQSAVIRAPKPVLGAFTWFTYNPKGYVHNVSLRGCQFYGNGKALASFYCVENLSIDDCQFYGGTQDGLTVEIARNVRITNTTVEASVPTDTPGVYRYGVVFHGQAENVFMSGNSFTWASTPHGQPSQFGKVGPTVVSPAETILPAGSP